MWNRYSAFLQTPPELTVAWHDPETEARGWLVINSLRGDAAGGGTRMREGATAGEACYLAKTMELKFALAGPPIGGAKSAIDFDPRDPRKEGVLRRWFQAILPHLRGHYGTGGDLNVDEVTEVGPLTHELGLEHPQEGVVRGHMKPDEARFQAIIDRLDAGVEAPVHEPLGVSGRLFTVSDLITGYGVARSLIYYQEQIGRPMDETRVVLEGFGNVGAATGLYLARAGARIMAIADIDKALVDEDGLNADEVEGLIVGGPHRLLPDDARCRFGIERTSYVDVPADVFVCAAASGTVTEAHLDRLEAAGVHTIVAGANQPFREKQPGATAIHQAADARFTVVPDFVANLGMARGFSYLMEVGAEPKAGPIFAKVDAAIRAALDEVLERTDGRGHGLMGASLDLALDRIGAP